MCSDPSSDWSFQMAKYNTDRWFPVVGVVEYWNETFALVENRFPSYFQGIKDFYYNVKGGRVIGT